MMSPSRLRPSAALALLTLALSSCAVNPVTGRRQLTLITEAQEIELGRGAAVEVRQSIGLVDDRPLQAYVGKLGSALAARSERPQLPWSFEVVDDPTPNAFALPGGFIFITRGLMSLMDSEAELVSVLGHEIGHVTARHSVTAISQQQIAQIGLGVGGIFVPQVRPLGDVLAVGLNLLFLQYGREAERQADELGFAYAHGLGYDMREMVDVFAALERAGGEQRSALPSWLQTHPAPQERIQNVQQLIQQLPPDQRGTRVERDPYLRSIDGMVYGVNPRHGFFRDAVFYHPDLRFRFNLPAGWTAQNLPRAVVAGPSQRDAVLQLTVAGEIDPAEAARQFLAPANVRAIQSSRTEIGGLPAAVSLFDAATEQGAVRGLVAHIHHRGLTYQLLGYAAAARFGTYQAVFERSIASFAAVTDPAILNVQPQRLNIVRISQAMTLAEFSQRYESAVPVAELALLNQVEGASSRLAAGTLVKRVVS